MSDQDVLETSTQPAATPAETVTPAENSASAPDLLATTTETPATAPAAPTATQVLEKRLADKDSHIQTLETENAKLRSDVADLQRQLDNVSDVSRMVEDMKTSRPISEQDVAAMVNQALTQAQTEQQMTANWNTFVAKATEAAGTREAANAQLQEFLSTTGMGVEELQRLGRQNPEVLLRAAGIKPAEQPRPTMSAPAGVVPSSSVQPAPKMEFTVEQYHQRLRDAGVKI